MIKEALLEARLCRAMPTDQSAKHVNATQRGHDRRLVAPGLAMSGFDAVIAPRAQATPAMVLPSVKAIAFYGDWLENKLTGEDEL